MQRIFGIPVIERHRALERTHDRRDLGGISGGLLASGLYVSSQDNVSGRNAGGLLGVTALGIAGGLAAAAGLTQSMPADRGVTTVDKPSDLSLEPMLLPMHGGTLIGAVGTF